jgi:hypothetical protein
VRNTLLLLRNAEQEKPFTWRDHHMKKHMTTSGVAGLLAMAALAPQLANAASTTTHHHHHHTDAHAAAEASLERRLQMMEDEMKALRAELAQSQAQEQSEKTQTQQLQAQQVETSKKVAVLEKEEDAKNDMIFFRGGYPRMEHNRHHELLAAGGDPFAGPTTQAQNKDGWYVGAGLDHRLTNDAWGLAQDIAVDGEIMFDYKNFGSTYNSFVSTFTGIPMRAQVTMTASPKIKYTGLGDFRPWIIPFGLGLNVISPPSSGVTVLNPGLQIGTGAEYRLWKDIYAGADFRYQFTGSDVGYTSADGMLHSTNTNYLEAGAYLGIGF